MGNEEVRTEPNDQGWRPPQVYGMATVCLALGLGIGYFLRGSQSPASQPHPPHEGVQAQAEVADTAGQAPSMEQMKHMADKSVAPVLEQLKSDPNNPELLNKAGNLYRATHQFKDAADYYNRALQFDPKNPAIRTDLASCLYYLGDVNGAIAQLEKALSYDPKFQGALLNIGIIKLRGKNDVAGAIASWETLLKTNPEPHERDIVKQMIAKAKQTTTPAE